MVCLLLCPQYAVTAEYIKIPASVVAASVCQRDRYGAIGKLSSYAERGTMALLWGLQGSPTAFV